MPPSVPLRSAAYFSHTCLVLVMRLTSPSSIFSHTSFTNTMCRSSFRVCIGPPGLQLSRNTTLPFYFIQYSKCERILRSFKLLLVNQQAPCTPSGCQRVLFTQIISAHIKFPRETILSACAIFYTSYVITHRANFITARTRSPYRSQRTTTPTLSLC